MREMSGGGSRPGSRYCCSSWGHLGQPHRRHCRGLGATRKSSGFIPESTAYCSEDLQRPRGGWRVSGGGGAGREMGSGGLKSGSTDWVSLMGVMGQGRQDAPPVAGFSPPEGRFQGDRELGTLRNVREAVWGLLLEKGLMGVEGESGTEALIARASSSQSVCLPEALTNPLACTSARQLTLRLEPCSAQLLVGGRLNSPHARLCSAGRGVCQEGDRRERSWGQTGPYRHLSCSGKGKEFAERNSRKRKYLRPMSRYQIGQGPSAPYPPPFLATCSVVCL